MNREILEQYGIDPGVSADVALTLLEKEKQKLLRKLNHVLGDPKKESELEKKLNQLEAEMEELEEAGGKVLSLKDVTVTTRALSQTVAQFTEEEEISEEELQQISEYEEMRKLEKQVRADGGKNKDISLVGIIQLAEYYTNRDHLLKVIQLLSLGVSWFADQDFIVLLYHIYKEQMDSQRYAAEILYWTQRAAKAGDKDACCDMGYRLIKKGTEADNLKKAAYYFSKGADRAHPNAYLMAGACFYHLKDYRRAETCFQMAAQADIPGAAYRLALIYDVDENSFGERQPDQALYWYEKAWEQKPDGDICLGLGELYAENGRYQEAETVLLQGKTEFGSEECAESLEELFLD